MPIALARRHAAGRILDAVAAWDASLSERLLRTDNATLDHTMRVLSRAADHSKVWAGVAAAAALSGRPDLRQGAALGLGSGALSSLLVNQGLKRALPRRRPAQEAVAVRRRLHRVPTSSSFPSGHAASAAAFATGMGLRAPRSLVVLGPLAGAVAFSRAHTGVHHVSDVLVGAMVGSAVAHLVHRLVEVSPEPGGAC